MERRQIGWRRALTAALTAASTLGRAPARDEELGRADRRAAAGHDSGGRAGASCARTCRARACRARKRPADAREQLGHDPPTRPLLRSTAAGGTAPTTRRRRSPSAPSRRSRIPGLTDLSKARLVAVFKRAGKETLDDNVPLIASALAYASFFAIPSVLLVAVGLFTPDRRPRHDRAT